MSHVLRALRAVGQALWWPVRLVREGEDDVDGTYPDRARPSGEQAATQGSVVTSITGLGHG